MSRTDVVWFYEHVDREVDIACAVKALVEEKHNLHIEIVQHPYGEMVADYQHLRPALILLPGVQGSYIPYLLEWPDAACVNLRWEQIFYPGIAGNKLIRGDLATRHVIHHAWGEFAREEMLAQGVPGENIYLNGNPVYALYQEPYRRYFAPRAELARRYGLDLEKKWLFFPENYKWAFFSDESIRRKRNPQESAEMKAFCVSSLREALQWCAELAAQGDVEVIVRPRPFTPREKFHEFALEAVKELPPNVRIMKDESVREWILASDVVASSYSTSLIESSVAGKPTYIFEPCPLPPVLYMPWQDLLPRLKMFDDLKRAAHSGEAPDSLGDWARKTMMSRGDSLNILADFIVGIAGGTLPRPPRPGRSSFDFEPVGRIPDWLLYDYYKNYRGFNRFRQRLLRRPFALPPTNEKDFVSAEEIQRRVARWKQVFYG